MKRITGHSQINLLTMALVLSLTAGCSKDDDNDTATPVEPKLGANYEGGIIFYIDGSGQHGLIAASADLSKSTPWFNGNFLLTGASSSTDGSANTTAIINAQGAVGTYAAKLCRDHRGGGHNDWFLPSKDQLNMLYTQKTLVGGFSNDIYWSSTESGVGEAWVQYFLDGTQHLDNTSDGATVGTRAIRSF